MDKIPFYPDIQECIKFSGSRRHYVLSVHMLAVLRSPETLFFPYRSTIFSQKLLLAEFSSQWMSDTHNYSSASLFGLTFDRYIAYFPYFYFLLSSILGLFHFICPAAILQST